MTKTVFPKQMYIYQDGNLNEEYWVAEERIEALPRGAAAVYVLQELGACEINHAFVSRAKFKRTNKKPSKRG